MYNAAGISCSLYSVEIVIKLLCSYNCTQNGAKSFVFQFAIQIY